jgi:hypothetical protein
MTTARLLLLPLLVLVALCAAAVSRTIDVGVRPKVRIPNPPRLLITTKPSGRSSFGSSATVAHRPARTLSSPSDDLPVEAGNEALPDNAHATEGTGRSHTKSPTAVPDHGVAANLAQTENDSTALAAFSEIMQTSEDTSATSRVAVPIASEVAITNSEIWQPDSDDSPKVTAFITRFQVTGNEAGSRHVDIEFDVTVINEDEISNIVNVAVYVRNPAIQLPRQIPWPSRKFVMDAADVLRERREAVLGDDADGSPFRRVILERIRLQEEGSALLTGEIHLDRATLQNAWERETLPPYSFGEYEIWLLDDDKRILFERRYRSIP